jgi:hypothetical protein
MLITYILFLTKLQKGKPCGMDLPLLKNKKGPGFIPDPFEYYLYSTTARIDITTRINVATAGINYVATTRINYITTGFRGFTIRSVGIS